MKTVTSVISNLQASEYQVLKPDFKPQPDTQARASDSIMTRLWAFMIQELGSAFRNQYGDAGGESYKYWSAQLAGYSPETIKRACDLFRKSDNTFISIARFRQLCDQTLACSQSEALELCLAGKWSQLPPVFQHMVAPRMYNLKRLEHSSCKREFSELYAKCLSEIKEGAEYEPIKAVEDQSNTNPSGVVHASRFASENGREGLRSVIASLKGA